MVIVLWEATIRWLEALSMSLSFAEVGIDGVYRLID